MSTINLHTSTREIKSIHIQLTFLSNAQIPILIVVSVLMDSFYKEFANPTLVKIDGLLVKNALVVEIAIDLQSGLICHQSQFKATLQIQS